MLFSHLYSVNETIYDPSLFAIGVAGLFAMMCGVMLMVLSRNSRLRMELRTAKVRCEELADFTWELKEAEARAVSLLEAQGDLIVRRDSEAASPTPTTRSARSPAAARRAARHRRQRCRCSSRARSA